MSNYFVNVKTIKEAEIIKRKLSKLFHPDNNGNATKFSDMINEFNNLSFIELDKIDIASLRKVQINKKIITKIYQNNLFKDLLIKNLEYVNVKLTSLIKNL